MKNKSQYQAYRILFWFTHLVCISWFSLAVAGGTTVGNGGGFVWCADLQTFKFVDQYFHFDEVEDYINLIDWQSDLSRIETLLKNTGDKELMKMAQNLGEFKSSMFNETNPNLKWRWRDSNQPLKRMFLPWYDKLIPSNCIILDAIHRFGNLDNDITYFDYDRNLIEAVSKKKGGPLMLSYLFIHEWLWPYFINQRNPQALAFANQFLHSKKTESCSTDELLSLFKSP